jgi:hypothetical protein
MTVHKSKGLDVRRDALRSLFGFIWQGRPRSDDVDPYNVPVHGFRASDASGQEQAAREARKARPRDGPTVTGPVR